MGIQRGNSTEYPQHYVFMKKYGKLSLNYHPKPILSVSLPSGMFQIWPARCAALIKKELMYAGSFGLAAVLCGSVFIDRINTKSALDTMKTTMKNVKEKRVSKK